MSATAGAGPAQSQKPRTQCQFPTWAVGTQVLGPSSAAFLGELAGSWIGNTTELGLKPALQYGMQAPQVVA